MRLLWSHTRDALVSAYKHKIVYEIPLVFENGINPTVRLVGNRLVVELLPHSQRADTNVDTPTIDCVSSRPTHRPQTGFHLVAIGEVPTTSKD